MSVIRVKKTENFVIIHKSALENPRLSFKAKGLFAYCMSRPDDWIFHVSHLSTVSKDGEDSVYSAIKELESEGYMRKVQKNVGGKFQKVDYEIFETPEELKKCLPHRDFPDAGFPDAGNPELPSIESSSSEEDIYKGKTNTKGQASPDQSESAFGKVKLKKEAYEELIKDFGKDVIDNKIKEMIEYAEEKPQKFREYKNHALTLRRWVKKDLEKNKDESKTEKPGLNALQKQNLDLNYELVNELKLDYPDKCGSMTVYYKEYVLKCKDPYFDISLLVNHKDFCRFLGKQFKMNILEVRFPNG